MQNNVPDHYKTDFKSFRTIRNIKKTLKARLKSEYGIENETILRKILKIHGLHSSDFDIMTNVENRILSNLNANELSIDSNANKSSNSIERVIQESIAPHRKLIGYDLLYRAIKKLYGRDEAIRLSSLMYDYTIAMHDSTKIYIPYCWALNGTQFLVNGRQSGSLNCSPAKHLHSYVSMLCGTIHTLANSALAGAIACGTFFLDSAAVLLKDGYTLDDLKTDKKKRHYVENMYQQLIYDLSDRTRNGVESPFTNLSIFDRVKLKKMLDETWWLFEDYNYDKDYIIDMIIECQNIYMDIFDKGDPLKDGMQFEFPVTTINLSLNDLIERKIVDLQFLDEISYRKIKRYNLFISQGSKTASCCRLINDEEAMNLASSVNSFGGGMNNLGSHRVVTPDYPRFAYMANSIDEFYLKLDSIIKDSVKILKAHKQLLIDLTESGMEPAISDGFITLSRMFSTLGIIGIYETVEILHNKFDLPDTLTSDILKFINDRYISEGRSAGLIPNIEQIPGEAMAVRMCEVTNLLLKKKDYVMYSNQSVPLWKEASIWERLEEDGKYNSLLTGGGIVHCQCDESLTPNQIKKIILKMASSGCEHTAINGIYSECENGHVLEKMHKDYCPKCGGKIKDYYTRVVGFLTKVSDWNTVRKNWEFMRRKFAKMNDSE